jgi:hypothetical protein
MNRTESRAFTIRRNQLDDLAELGIEVEPPAHDPPWPRYAPLNVWLMSCVLGTSAVFLLGPVAAYALSCAPAWVSNMLAGFTLCATLVVGLARLNRQPPKKGKRP